MDDEKLAVSMLKNGNIKGLEPLVRAHYIEAVRSAYLIVGDRAQAEGIVQEEFLALRRKIHKFDAGRPFRPWFMRCVVNSTINRVRSNNRLISLDASIETGTLDLIRKQIAQDADPESLVEDKQLRLAVWNALEQLSAKQRASIVMRYYLGLNQAEMVEKMDAPASSVKWWLHSARKRLRQLLGPVPDGDVQQDDLGCRAQIETLKEEQSHG